MNVGQVTLGRVRLGPGQPLALIAGPCVIESEDHALHMAHQISTIATRQAIPLVFKASFDKANRTSIESFRGPGLAAGLRILGRIKEELDVPVLTDIHEPSQAKPVAEVVDVLQIPAFLCRQTDLVLAAVATGRAVNIKKGQFLTPNDMRHVVAKATAGGYDRVIITERGVSFGYNNLVVDMRAFPILRTLGCPVVFDVTHSLQLPGAGEGFTTGQPEMIEPLAAAGVAAGVDGVFLEVHDKPSQAKSDAQSVLPLERLEPLVQHLQEIDRLTTKNQNGEAPT